MATDVTERLAVNKPAKTYPRPLADLVNRCLGDVFAKQGFASADIVTHWPDIVGPEIAAHAEPMKLQWPRGGEEAGPATLVLRVEGPAAVEIQHLAGVILERVNQFFGWRAVDRIALRQAPLARRAHARVSSAPSAEATARVAAQLPEIVDESLRNALARLGAAIKRP
jgi:hypothetical protein